jgi:YcxB-like protein
VDSLVLRYTPEVEDIMELLARVPRTRRIRNRAVRNAATSLVLLALWLAATWDADPFQDSVLLTVFLFATALSYTRQAVVLSTRWGLRRRARRVRQKSPRLRMPHEEVVGPDAMTMRVDGVSHAVEWRKFGELVETERQFILLDLDGDPALALPKRGFDDPALVPECRRLLTTYLGRLDEPVTPTEA